MDLIIIGASARAAAFSAHRAGMRPWCVDLFGDADLARRFPARRIALADYPHGLTDALKDAPDAPVLYTGGLENYPDLLARIDRPLCGNPPDVLRRVRDPFLLADVLRRNGWPTLEVRRDPPPRGDPRRWLLKPLRSSGGVGIRAYAGGSFNPSVHYLQEGTPARQVGAVFLGMPQRGAILLGETRPLFARALGAPPFHYGGSVGSATALPNHELTILGDLLVREFRLAGLFGIDAVRSRDGRPALLEVNPRYTASVEIIERIKHRPLLDLHRAVFDQRVITWIDPATSASGTHGKATVYARRDLTFPPEGPWQGAFTQPTDAVEYADIPHPGDIIPRGRPVLTVFASAPFDVACTDALLRKVQALDPYLHGG